MSSIAREGPAVNVEADDARASDALREGPEPTDVACGDRPWLNPIDDYSEIDPLIRDLVRDLNAAGLHTYSSCQGWTEPSDVRDEEGCKFGHCRHSFVSFEDRRVLRGKKRKARALGLYVYNGGESLTALPDDDLANEEVIAANREFSARVRSLFGLPGRRPPQ